MEIEPELLEILACPACRERVDPAAEGAGLECRRCGLLYPVRDGIPVLLVEEAVPVGPREPRP